MKSVLARKCIGFDTKLDGAVNLPWVENSQGGVTDPLTGFFREVIR